MDWKQLFQPRILERGFEYYKNGHVEEYYEEDGSIQAVVQGSCEYDVSINIEEEEISDMECDCPYAEEGHNCKHMAAVLFYMENGAEEEIEEEETKEKERKEPELSVSDLVKNADETVVRNYLTEILKHDAKLLGRFKNALRCGITERDMRRYKNQIDRIYSSYTGRYGYIEYGRAGSFLREMEEFLEVDVGGVVESRQYKAAFELVCYVFVKVANQDMDDSGGESGMLAEDCLEIWEDLESLDDMELKRFMYQWMKEHLYSLVSGHMKEYLERMLFDHFKEPEFQEDKLELTEKKVNEYAKKENSWSRTYYGGKWVMRHISVMEEMKLPRDSIDGYVAENLDFSVVREYYLKQCIDGKRYDEAIRVLKKGKEAERDSPGLVAKYSLQLKELYRQTGRMEDYKKELWKLLLQYEKGDIKVYRELKALYTKEEWAVQRETIFKKLSPYAAVHKLYEEEQLYDRLLKLVLASNGLDMLVGYEECLKPLYPEELLKKYETVLEGMAARTSDRGKYCEMVGFLRRMQSYPGGSERVMKISENWRSRYRNRRAMMEELAKLNH